MTPIYSLRALGKTEKRIKCIPNNKEKYISLNKDVGVASFINNEGNKVDIKHEHRFIDSFKVMASSLDTLVSNLSLDKLKETEKVFGDKIKLVSRKSIYRYHYMEQINKFNDTKLPKKK